MPVVAATKEDIPALVRLMDSAYRGESSKKGWTTEADLLLGNKRTDESTLERLFGTPGTTFLKYLDEKEEMLGCVFLHKKGSRLYLGMLSVNPELQARGTGKQLMKAAEEHALANGCQSIFMNVISVRQELIQWYERLGYHKTGQTEPFPVDERFGMPSQPLVFVIMEKPL